MEADAYPVSNHFDKVKPTKVHPLSKSTPIFEVSPPGRISSSINGHDEKPLTSTKLTSDGMKPNIGVYTNPAHELWISDAQPDVAGIRDGASLKDGEVTVEIKNTGICG